MELQLASSMTLGVSVRPDQLPEGTVVDPTEVFSTASFETLVVTYGLVTCGMDPRLIIKFSPYTVIHLSCDGHIAQLKDVDGDVVRLPAGLAHVIAKAHSEGVKMPLDESDGQLYKDACRVIALVRVFGSGPGPDA